MATEELECCEDCQIHPDRLDIVNSGMPEEEELYDLAELFRGIWRFDENPYSVCAV